MLLSPQDDIFKQDGGQDHKKPCPKSFPNLSFIRCEEYFKISSHSRFNSFNWLNKEHEIIWLEGLVDL